jgi:hypothetical protein
MSYDSFLEIPPNDIELVLRAKGLPQELADQGGPIKTPLVVMSFPTDKNAEFGADTPPGQPGELAPRFVFLATDDSRCISGEVLGATGGKAL